MLAPFWSDVVQAVADALAILVVDAQTGEIRHATRPLEEMFGYFCRGELLGKSVEELVPLPLQERHAQHRIDYTENPKNRPMGAGLGMDLMGMRRDLPRIFWQRVDIANAPRRPLSGPGSPDVVMDGPWFRTLWGDIVSGWAMPWANTVRIGWRVDGSNPTRTLAQTAIVQELGHCCWSRLGKRNLDDPADFVTWWTQLNDALTEWEESR